MFAEYSQGRLQIAMILMLKKSAILSGEQAVAIGCLERDSSIIWFSPVDLKRNAGG